MITYDWNRDNIKFMPTLPRAEPLLQDSTAMKAFMKCKRYYFNRIVCGRVSPVEKNQRVFDFGSAYHKFRELLQTQNAESAFRHILDSDACRLIEVDPKSKWIYLDRVRLVATCKAALEVHRKEESEGRIKVLATEQLISVQLEDSNIFVGGRADEIISWNGGIYGRDWKTTSKDQLFFERELDPNDQGDRYFYTESKLQGTVIKGVIFDAVYNTKTVGPKFHKPVLIGKSFAQQEMWIQDQYDHNDILNRLREKDHWPKETGYQCSFCEFAKVCRLSSERAMEATLKSEYKFMPWDCSLTEQEEG